MRLSSFYFIFFHLLIIAFRSKFRYSFKNHFCSLFARVCVFLSEEELFFKFNIPLNCRQKRNSFYLSFRVHHKPVSWGNAPQICIEFDNPLHRNRNYSVLNLIKSGCNHFNSPYEPSVEQYCRKLLSATHFFLLLSNISNDHSLRALSHSTLA